MALRGAPVACCAQQNRRAVRQPPNHTPDLSRSKSHDEARAEYIEKMGGDLGHLFHVLDTELTWVHWRWQQFRALYGDKEERIVLLNDSAPLFFHLLQSTLFNDTLLSIAWLVGPERTAGQPNLTIRRLPPLISDESFSAETARLVEAAVSAAAFATDRRNRHLAHRDLALSLDQTAEPLAEASRKSVEEALEELRACLNVVQRHFTRATTAYSHSPLTGDAEALLYVLQAGQLRLRERDTFLRRGEAHPDDLDTPPAV